MGKAVLFPKISHPKKRAVLSTYVKHGRLVHACELADTDPGSHYYWLKTDPDYVEAYAEAQGMVADMLEAEAMRRATGYEETHYTLDGTPYPVAKHSDTLLIFLLKGAKPQKYRERYEHSGADGAPLQIVLTRREGQS